MKPPEQLKQRVLTEKRVTARVEEAEQECFRGKFQELQTSVSLGKVLAGAQTFSLLSALAQ